MALYTVLRVAGVRAIENALVAALASPHARLRTKKNRRQEFFLFSDRATTRAGAHARVWIHTDLPAVQVTLVTEVDAPATQV